MRKRLSSKMLAVILTLAICATTVLGCLMTVGAATSCYRFGEGKFNGDDLTQATIDVTFTAPASLQNGFVAGAFSFTEADADGTDYLIFQDVTSADVNVAVEDNYVIFDSEDAVKTAKFTFTVAFSTGAATDKTYKVALGDVELAYNDAEYYIETDGTGTPGEITAACKHVIGLVGESVATDEVNNYSVYENSVCTKCGETFGRQLVPTANKDDLVGDNVPSGTIDLLEFGSYLTDMGSASTYWDSVVADNGETGASWNDPIIIDSAEEFVYLCKGATDNATAGKYYKVADGIAGFNLSTNALDLNGTLAENLATIQGSGKNHAGGTNVYFQGNFDGNGITVYGAVCSSGSYTGLFSYTKGDVTIKNVNVKLSSFVGATAAGGIVGYHLGDGTNSLIIENCSVTDTYLETQGTSWGCGVGAIIGHEANLSSWKEADKGVDGNNDGDTADTIYVNGTCNITNCYVNLDPTYFVSTSASTNVATRGGLVGWCTTNAMKADKCVVIGVTPYATNQSATDNNVQHMGLETHFTNIYTDTGSTQAAIGGTLGTRNFTNKIFVLTDANMKGSAAVINMPNLDWGNTWVMDGTNTYPRLATPNEVFDTIYWDGSSTKTAPTVGSGKKEDPFIISTVAELAYIGGQARDSYTITDGNYYKIADGIKSIVMQPYAYGNDIKALGSAADTKSYFETNAASMKTWLYYGWEGSTFCGNIDFNGATVYGIYQVSSNNAGLFSNIDAGAVISNLTIKNSYMVSQSSGANYQVGAIAAVTNAAGYGKSTTGFIWLNNCTVANNYMYCNATFSAAAQGGNNRAGVLIGASSDVIYTDNCLVYGNDATLVDGTTMPLFSSASNGLLVSSNPAIPEGLTVVSDGNTEERYHNKIRNSIILGAKPYDLTQANGSRFNDMANWYENVYTDADFATDTFSNGTIVADVIKNAYQITAADATGSAAATAMPNLTWGTDWYCGVEGEYPVQAALATLGTSSVSTPSLQLVGTNVTYNDDGSLDLNIHFVPETAGVSPVLYVGTYDASKFMKLNAVASSKTAELGANALMYVIPNLSARDIELVWLPTLVNSGSVVVEWGKSEQIALADNARAIIAGDYAQADKNVAAALLNYGNASGVALDSTYDYNPGTYDLLEFGDYLTEAGSSSKYYDSVLADNGETGADWDNAIIIDNAEEFVYLAKASGNDTKGKYYKVADGIAGFNLATNKLDITKSLEANLDVITGSGKNHAGNTPGFQGHFDGNGITVYGAWCKGDGNYAGLFSATKGDVTIKNVNVKLSYIKAKNAAGGIVGYHEMTKTLNVAKSETTSSGALVLPENGSLTIENCSVTDCYIETTAAGYGCGSGAILGYEANSWADSNINYASGLVDDSALTLGYYDVDGNGQNTYYNGVFTINNCIVDLDAENLVSNMDSSNQTVHGGLAAYANTNAGVFKNCIVIGVTPYSTYANTANNNHQHTALASHFSNIYTDAATGTVTIGGSVGTNDYTNKVFQLTLEQMTGDAAKANMPELDWNSTWTTTSGYPNFINKNYEAPASGYTIYYTGTAKTIGTVAPTEGSGTKDDPFIINTVEELAYVAGQTPANIANVQGKYFKVADGISAIVLQKADYVADIMALGSAAETKAYFEANKANMVYWPNYGWEGSTFCGNIDFNGATVYGLFQESTNNAGLFSTIEAGAVISNLGIRNSYITSTNASYNVGAIAAYTNTSGYAAKLNGVIWVKNATIANNYIYGAHDPTGDNNRVAVAYGSVSDNIYTDNILVYGNDATYGAAHKAAPFMASAGNAIPETVAVPEGLVVKYTGTNASGQKLHTNVIRNSIILGCTPYDLTQVNGSRFNDLANCYENLYNDSNFATDTFSNGTVASSLIKGATQVTDYSILKGAAAQSIVDTFNSSFGSTVWYVGADGDYPAFKAAGTMSSATQALYDGMILNNADDYGDSADNFGVYATGLNLKVNPYMTFTFVFGYDLVKEDIQVTFKSGDTVIETVTAADMVNNEGAGRYHLYRLKSVPVIALATGVTVSVTYGGETTDFGTYSAEGFALMAENASKLEPCDYYANLYEASKALLFYADMLAARYGA